MIREGRRRYLEYGGTTGDRVALKIELTQLREEGKDTTGLAARVEDIWKIEDLFAREKACEAFLQETYRLPLRKDFPFEEPDAWEAIQKVWRYGGAEPEVALSEEAYADKLYGGVLGRCVGCLLGKPVEQWPRPKIIDFLKENGQYPLTWYITAGKSGHGGLGHVPDYMVTDDDIEYVMTNLYTLEAHGRDCSSEDIGYTWLSVLPMRIACSAEKIAFRNMSLLREPPLSGTYANPYREWIGAQIRADIWGYINPGNPRAAVEMAYRDAVVSHVKNGVYCTMFVAALVAQAFVTDDIPQMIRTAQQFVPQKSRTFAAIEDCFAWKAECADFDTTLVKMYEKYGHYHAVHAINNLCICLLSLLYSQNDYEKAIIDSVMAGLDTDCNGATVGSVMGIIVGAKKLPARWTAQLHDTYHTHIDGQGKLKISDIAKRIAAFRG